MVTDVSPEQPQNAALPIEVTEFGMVTDVSPEHSLKADIPIEVTELGMETEVNPLQLPNAPFPIDVTVDGILNLVLVPGQNNSVVKFLSYSAPVLSEA
jgi:hypothetical protein